MTKNRPTQCEADWRIRKAQKQKDRFSNRQPLTRAVSCLPAHLKMKDFTCEIP